jgi:hypothetical protein
MNCPRCAKNIDEHPANKCMDAWVAIKVLAYTAKRVRGADGVTREYWLTDKKEIQRWMFKPSSDISRAWEIVERLTDETQRFELITGHQDIAWIIGEKSGPKLGSSVCGVGDSMPHAICRAALKASP